MFTIYAKLEYIGELGHVIVKINTIDDVIYQGNFDLS